MYFLHQKHLTRLFCFVFILTITLPLVVSVIKAPDVQEIERLERRSAAKWPKWPEKKRDREEWVRDVGRYVDDHFTFRRNLVQLHHRILSGLNISSSRSVVYGKNDWLFYGGDELMDLRGMGNLTSLERMRWDCYLREIRNGLQKEGIPFLLVVTPDKSSVYPEYLPRNLRGDLLKSRKSDLLGALRKWLPEEELLDLCDPVRGFKAEGQLYFKHDTHWNYLGGALAADVILERLAARGFPVKPLGLKSTDFTPLPSSTYDLLRLLGEAPRERAPVFPLDLIDRFQYEVELNGPDLRRIFPNPAIFLHSTVNPSGHGRLLMIRDSFAIYMADCISTQFAEADYVWAPANIPEFMASATQVLAAVQARKPTLVIFEVLERLLAVVPSQSGSFQDFLRETFETLPQEVWRWSEQSKDSLKFTPSSLKGRITGESIHWTQSGLTRPGRLTFREVRLDQEGLKILHAKILSPQELTVKIVVSPLASEESDRTEEPIRLQKGWNEIWVALPEIPLQRELRIESGTLDGDLEISELSIRHGARAIDG